MQKYFNEGNDCDMCKHKFMTGQDGTVEDCRRREFGLPCNVRHVAMRSIVRR